MSVIKDSIVIGHLPRKISVACSIFIDLGGRINCCITGSRCYSWDLPQGGLEISCKILFRGSTQHVAKLTKYFGPTRKSANPDNSDQPAKRIKVEVIFVKVGQVQPQAL